MKIFQKITCRNPKCGKTGPDRVWATDIEISAAANFLQTDIYTYTETPDKNTTFGMDQVSCKLQLRR